MARADERVLVTFDKDFGELVYRRGAASSPGIILFRFLADSPVALTREIVSAVGSRDDWAGSFSVVEEGRIRMRPLPP